MKPQNSRYACSICGTDAEASVNILTMAGIPYSKVAAMFGVSRSSVHRHRKHFAERILLVDREGAKKLMDEVQAFADEFDGLDVADLWRHLYHRMDDYPKPTDENWPWGLKVLALAGIEPYCCQLADSLLRFFRTQHDAVKVPRVALDETLNMLTQTSFVERLEAVHTPTLVVGGLHDPILTPTALREGVVAPLPRARLVLLDGNHELPIETPLELAGLIGAFLAGLPPA